MTKSLKGKGLSLDLDGTLYRVIRWRVAWRLRKDLGYVKIMLKVREGLRKEAPAETAEAFKRREAEIFAQEIGVTVDAAQIELVELKQKMARATTFKVRPFEGLKESLAWAHEAGVRLAVYSDYAPDEKLRNLGLDALPWVICLGAEDTGALKPHARGFDRIAEALDLSPADILHLGDREDLDVEGAAEAGMKAALFGMKPLESRTVGRLTSWKLEALKGLFDETWPSGRDFIGRSSDQGSTG